MSLKSPVTGLRSPVSASNRAFTVIQLNPLIEFLGANVYSDLSGTQQASFGDSVARLDSSVVLLNSNATSPPVFAREPSTGTRNQILYSNSFSDVNWLRTNSNVSTVADGWRLVDSGAGGTNTVLIRQIYTAQSGVNSFSVEAKQDQLDQIALRAFSFDSDSTSYFSLSAGTVLSEGASHSASIEELTDGWYRVGIEFSTVSDVSGLVYVYAASALNSTLPLDGTSSILIRNAQAEGGSRTAYQETKNEYDVTESGVRSVHYLSFDGVDDELSNSTFDTQSSSWTVLASANVSTSFQVAFANANITALSTSFSATVSSNSTNSQNYSRAFRASHFDELTALAAERDTITEYSTGTYSNTSAEFKVSGGAKLYGFHVTNSSLSDAPLSVALDRVLPTRGEV